MKQYRLGSTEMVSAPGMVRWAINGAKFKSDQTQMIKVIIDGWGISEAAATALVLQQVPYTIEDETIVFSY